jgi:hypothetical protein
MSMDPISYAYMGLSGFKAYEQYEAGKEAQAAYEGQAAEIERQTAYAQRMALEEQKQLTREGSAQQSQVRAAAGGSGLRVGGSVATLSQSIANQISRRKSLVAMQFNEQARQNAFTAGQYRKAGRQAKKSAGWQAVGSLLTGGLATYRHMDEKGLSLFGRGKSSTAGIGGYRTTGYGTF